MLDVNGVAPFGPVEGELNDSAFGVGVDVDHAGNATAMTLQFLLSLLLTGLIIGALGRLAVPGPNPMGIITTILCGIAGSLVGGILARALGLGGWLPFVVAVLCAAAIVYFLTGATRRRGGVLAGGGRRRGRGLF